LTTKFAVRTLGRSKRRTLLSVIGVGVGCAVALFLTAFMRGANEMRVQSIADSGFGHLRIAPGGWEKSRENALRLQDGRAELETVRAMEGVKVAAPHARSTALLAFGTRVAGVELLGVDPPAEQAVSRVARAVSEGRYLESGDKGLTVIGSTIAERLDVELDDDLFLTIVREGGRMEYAMLRIVGIIDTGSRDLDATICHVTLEDVRKLTDLNGAAEITITLNELGDLDRMAATLRTVIPQGDDVLTWKEVQPAQGADFESDKRFTNIFIVIVVVVVMLGITSAQLTAILERRREFAVLIALGMKSIQVTRLVFVEAAAMGLLGAAAGLLLAMPLVYYTATTGIDFSKLMGEGMSMSGVLFNPVMYSDMGLWMIPHALLIALISTLIAALYPAWYAVKIDPTSALSLREA
jgi:ABC-type lipoprotein release transport system permease subunit